MYMRGKIRMQINKTIHKLYCTCTLDMYTHKAYMYMYMYMYVQNICSTPHRFCNISTLVYIHTCSMLFLELNPDT